MIKIALIDDHVVLRNSLATLIALNTDVSITIQASCGGECIQQLKLHAAELPDIIILDISMPGMDGTETARWLKNNYPGIRVIILSMLHSEYMVIRMLRIGAAAYLSKSCEPAELYAAIRAVYKNGYYYNELFTPVLKKNDTVYFPRLSSQELCFIRWACTEKTYKEIAVEMNVCTRTVDNYRDALFEKLSVNSRIGIAMFAIRNQIVQV